MTENATSTDINPPATSLTEGTRAHRPDAI